MYNIFMKYVDENISHNFQNLRAYLAMPHRAYRPLFIGDTDHNNWGLQQFLCSAFFNIEILGNAGRRTIFHELPPEGLAEYDPDLDDADNNKLAEQLENIGINLSCSFMRRAWLGLGEVLSLSRDRGTQISFCNLVDMNILEQKAEEMSYDKEAENVNRFIGARWPELISLHKEIMGHDFPMDKDSLLHVCSLILLQDLDEEVFRHKDGEIASFIKDVSSDAQPDAENYTIIFGSEHSNNELKEGINGRYGCDILEISYRWDCRQMVSKIYRGYEVGPTYSIVNDSFAYPEDFEIDTERLPDFREALRQSYEDWKSHELQPAALNPQQAASSLTV